MTGGVIIYLSIITSPVNNDSLEMKCIVMTSALNSKLHSKIFMSLLKIFKFNVDVVLIYYYVKKWLNLKK